MSLLLFGPRRFSSGYHYRVPTLIASGRRRKRTLSCKSRPAPSSNIKSSAPRHSFSNDVLQSLLLVVTVACFLSMFDGHAMAAGMSQHSKSAGYSCANVSHYYEGVDGLEGEQLRKKIFKIIRNHHIIPYAQVWDALKLLDAADSDNPEASFDVIEIYSQKAVSKRLAGKPDGWNREHLWPRSYGLIRGRPEFNDLHNLRPADVNVNSARGNKYYGECTQTSNKICAVPANQEAALDTATDTKIWMPPLKVRGDIARSLMYMAVRYGTSEVDGEFHLQLSDTPNAGTAHMGLLSVLLKWNFTDPPSGEEKVRNSRVCTLYQHNRNPFVDHPEFAYLIWGRSTLPEFPDGLIEDSYTMKTAFLYRIFAGKLDTD